MGKRSETTESYRIEGTLTVVSASESSHVIDYGGGDIEVEGKIYTDNIFENTDDTGVNVEGIHMQDKYITMENINPPTQPSLNNTRFYIESNILKSKNNLGIITTYQPTTSKGDLLTHNGTTQERLPMGPSGYLLSIDSSTYTGLKWVKNSGTLQSNSFIINGTGSNNIVYVVNYYYGAFLVLIYPFIVDGGSSIILTTKSRVNLYGHVIRLCSNPSIINEGKILCIWSPYKEVGIYKDYTEADGNYYIKNNSKYLSNNITLNGTSWVSLGSEYNVNTGVFSISIYSDNNGPAATFLVSKSISSLNVSAVSKISSSPGTGTTNLLIRWQASTGIEISKTSTNDDGIYNVINNFQDILSTSVTLNGISPTNISMSFFRFYENKSFMMRIYSNNVINSPKSLIFMSKNIYTLSGNKNILQSSGQTTNEKINLNWNTSSLLSINKTGNNYDGSYIIDITTHE